MVGRMQTTMRLISMSKMKLMMMMVMCARMLMVHGNECGDDHDDCSDVNGDGNTALLVTCVCYEACDGCHATTNVVVIIVVF